MHRARVLHWASVMPSKNYTLCVEQVLCIARELCTMHRAIVVLEQGAKSYTTSCKASFASGVGRPSTQAFHPSSFAGGAASGVFAGAAGEAFHPGGAFIGAAFIGVTVYVNSGVSLEQLVLVAGSDAVSSFSSRMGGIKASEFFLFSGVDAHL